MLADMLTSSQTYSLPAPQREGKRSVPMNANTTAPANFGEFLQRKREEKQITLRKMAEMLGFSAPFLSDVEKDRRNPPELAKLEQIADILGLSYEEKETMYNHAGKKRDTVAPDLPEYIMNGSNFRVALRLARDKGIPDAAWQKVIYVLEAEAAKESQSE